MLETPVVAVNRYLKLGYLSRKFISTIVFISIQIASIA
jgi:hypothetical protein